jgi:septum formation protein
MPPPSDPLVLGSTSPYRRELLARLRLPFSVVAPGVDEGRQSGEAPESLARRFATLKAEFVARAHARACVIGADQAAECEGAVLGKPGSAEQARAQLATCSGRVVTFHTAVQLVRHGARGEAHVDRTRVVFRRLSVAEIARYVELDEPLDCAGSFRAEALGVALFERIETEDPTALVGLPLIWLAGALRRAGYDPLASGS